MKNLNILKSHGFILGLLLLLLNDFVLKELLSNWFTGKLSDFAGLFIFPLFWIALFPKHKFKIFWGTAIFFLFWKSGYSESSIEIWNSLGIIRISRVVDYSDLIAILMISMAYRYNLNYQANLTQKRLSISPIIPLFVALFAFGATSYDKNIDYNKVYIFSFSKQELIKRMNAIENDGTFENYPLSLHTSMINYYNVENLDSLAYYVSEYKTRNDTIFHDALRKKVDTVYTYEVPTIDSMYPNRENVFHFNFPVYKYMKISKTGYCHSLPAKIILGGDGNSSSITLVTIFTHNCMGMFEKEASKKERENLLEAFEKEVVGKVKN